MRVCTIDTDHTTVFTPDTMRAFSGSGLAVRTHDLGTVAVCRALRVSPTTRASTGMQLFPSILAIAASLGATCVIGAMTRAVARLYQRCGLALQLVNTVENAGRPAYLIGAIELSRSTFTNLGRDAHALLGAVTWLGARHARVGLSTLAPPPETSGH